MKVNDLMSTDAIEILQKIVDACKHGNTNMDVVIGVWDILDKAGLLEDE